MSRLKKNLQSLISCGPRAGAWLLAAGAAVVMAGCAPIPAGPSEYAAGRSRMVLPSVAWEDLGKSEEALPFYPLPGAIPMQTRAVGLRGANQELLAVLLVQSNSTNHPREETAWTKGVCPHQNGLMVEDAARSSPVRVDCLRFKRWANDRDDWMQKNHSPVLRWLADHNIVLNTAYSHLNYRFSTDTGAYIEVNALVDSRLLHRKPPARGQFNPPGQPAHEWSRKVAEAARVSTAMVDGFFPVPAFPMPMPE